MRIQEGDEVYFQVLGPNGELLAGDASLPVPSSVAPHSGAPVLRDEQLQGEALRLATVWRRVSTERPGWITVQVAETLGKRQRMASDIVKSVLLPQFVLLPLAALLGWLALVQGLKPLKALSERIRLRTADDLSPIAERDTPEEILPLVRATNELLARREQAAQLQHQFLANAAHQLKTPLAGLRTQAELAGRALRSGQANPIELEQSFAQIAKGSQRAAHLVNQLLALAKAEAGAPVAQEPIDLAELARDVTQDFVPHALERRIDLGFEGPETCQLHVQGQRWQLVELLRNLVDNALRYTPRGGEVTVRVREDPFGKVVALQVEDSGPGIAPEARERVFQPFYRQLGTGVDGSGLGLTIAGQIAERHGSRIELEDARDRRTSSSQPGARFTLRLPGQDVSDRLLNTPQ
jgi:two-component system sensor histidine kinase TctE